MSLIYFESFSRNNERVTPHCHTLPSSGLLVFTVQYLQAYVRYKRESLSNYIIFDLLYGK